jgi:hypothetical protein
MPQSRKRRGHPYKKPADIPASQRVAGKSFWAILLGVFGLFISYFAAGDNYIIMLVSTAAAALIGYFIGRSMEKRK